jgi:hypothetical protein
VKKYYLFLGKFTPFSFLIQLSPRNTLLNFTLTLYFIKD